MINTRDLIAKIVSTGAVETPDGIVLDLHSAIAPEGGDLISHICSELNPVNCIEIGMAYGLSSLYVLDCLQKIEGGHLTSIDPFQSTAWKGVGIHNVKSTGNAKRHNLIEDYSSQALPQLVSNGQRIQLAFIDGMHTFDYALIDFFFIDQLLDVGGVVIFDDFGYAALKKVVSFVLANREYAVHSFVDTGTREKRFSAKMLIKRASRRASLTNLDLPTSLSKIVDRLPHSGLVALIKTKDDERKHNHFVGF